MRVRGRSVVPELSSTVIETKTGSAAEIWVDGDIPCFEQPFWDVASVSVFFAPFAQLGRDGVVFRC